MRKMKLFSFGVLLVLVAISAVWAWDTLHKDGDTIVQRPAPTSQRIGRMVYLEGGTFRIGSDFSADADARPAHDVSVDPFYIDEHEVTNRQFARFVDGTGYRTMAEQRGWSLVFDHQQQQWVKRRGTDWRHPWGPNTSLDGRDDYPVVHVSWDDAEAMSQWLSSQGRVKIRLPTEAEWEYACRAKTSTFRYWGDDAGKACGYANAADRSFKEKFPGFLIHNCEDGYVYTAPGGSFHPNEFGLFDMLGNVWEWCEDWYDKDFYKSKKSKCRNPVCKNAKSAFRVLRGGSWYDSPRSLRCALRSRSNPGLTNLNFGFRLVCVPSQS